MTPCSSATVHRREKVIDLGNSLARGLQHGVHSISVQCLPWPVAYSMSEVPVWLTVVFRFWGKMTPKVKIFQNVFQDFLTGHQSTFCDQIWWKSAVVKLPKGCVDYHTKKLGLHGTGPSSHFAQNGRIAAKIPWTLSPFNAWTYTEFGPDRLHFAGLILERLIFLAQKVNTIYAFSLQWIQNNKLLMLTIQKVPINYRTSWLKPKQFQAVYWTQLVPLRTQKYFISKTTCQRQKLSAKHLVVSRCQGNGLSFVYCLWWVSK